MSEPIYQLDRLITIEQKVSDRDTFGQPVETWAPVAAIGSVGRIWAKIDPIRGREYFASQATQREVQTKIITHFNELIVPSMRIVCGSEIYNIQAVLPQGRKWLFLMCGTGLNNG